MIAYVIPTRDRADRLDETLARIDALGDHGELGGARVIIADNASAEPYRPTSPNRVPVTVLRMDENLGAAARNECARAAEGCEWLIMLDDDSHPTDLGYAEAILHAPDDAAAITADIMLPDGSRERGGLPEVPVGCGVALRRDVFLGLGGYDPAFGYYAEEYDLAAKLIAAGHRVLFEPAFRVRHEKARANRDFGVILRRLVRNNGWVIQRYAPDDELEPAMRAMLSRYDAIAQQEGVSPSYSAVLDELERTLAGQPRLPLAGGHWARFTGASHADEALAGAQGRCAIIDRGKHAEIIERALAGLGATLVDDRASAERVVIGTLSPGPMFDALHRHGSDPRVIAPWSAAERFRPSPVRAAV